MAARRASGRLWHSGCFRSAFMLIREFVDLAATIAGYAPGIIRRSPSLRERSIHAYWVASRSRLNRWGAQLRRLQLLQGSGLLRQTASPEDLRVLEEILVSEIATRVWCAVLHAIDERLEFREYSPIGRSIYLGHLESRQRVLKLMVAGLREGPVRLWTLNQTRVLAERWADLLLASLPSLEVASVYCFDEQRLRSFVSVRERWREGMSVAPLLVSGGGACFDRRMKTCSANDDLHGQVQQAILGCLPADLFSGTGAWEANWPARIEVVTDELLGHLDHWLGDRTRSIRPDRGSQGTLGRFF